VHCFEILGFDVLLDENAKPFLLEVNHAPSFGTDSPLDYKIKGELIRDTIQMLGLSLRRKKQYKHRIAVQTEKRIKTGKSQKLPAEVKEAKRREFEALRDKHESVYCGQYERIECESEEYLEMLGLAQEFWAKKTGARVKKAAEEMGSHAKPFLAGS